MVRLRVGRPARLHLDGEASGRRSGCIARTPLSCLARKAGSMDGDERAIPFLVRTCGVFLVVSSAFGLSLWCLSCKSRVKIMSVCLEQLRQYSCR